jgi:hypothetical protein
MLQRSCQQAQQRSTAQSGLRLGIEVARVGLDLRTEPRESAPWRSHRSASRCKPLALGLVASGPTHLIFVSPGRASQERQERIWAVKEVPETSLTSPRLTNPSIWIVHTVHKTSAPAALPSPVNPSAHT